MTRENLKKVIDPLFALSVFFLMLFIGVSVLLVLIPSGLILTTLSLRK